MQRKSLRLVQLWIVEAGPALQDEEDGDGDDRDAPNHLGDARQVLQEQ